MKANQADYPVKTLCEVLGVSRSGFYAWRDREPSARARADEKLVERIGEINDASRGTYGVPRIHAELQEGGIHVGRKRIARLMKANGIQGVSRRKGYKTTRKGRDRHGIPDLVERDFTATAPDQLWVADITYVPTWSGFVFLAVVLDVFSRKIVGRSMASHLRTELVLDALNMAITTREPEGVVHHSDQEQATEEVTDRRPPRIVARASRRSARPALRSSGRGRRALSTLTESAASRDGRSRDCWVAVDSGFCRLLQGCQYTSIAFGKRCEHAGVRPWVGSVGDCYDNAMRESFFASLECELIERSSFETKTQAKMELFTYIEGFYNPHRRHSALGYLSPAALELQHRQEALDARRVA